MRVTEAVAGSALVDAISRAIAAGDPPHHEVVRRYWAAVYDDLAGQFKGWEAVEPASLLDLSPIEPGMRVLDVGTGVGEGLARCRSQVGASGAVHGIDVSFAMMERCRSVGGSGGLGLMDAARLAVRSSTCDGAYASMVLMLLPRPELALAELHRVIRPDGFLAFSTFASYGSLDGLVDHLVANLPPHTVEGMRMTDVHHVEVLLREAGFEICESVVRGERGTGVTRISFLESPLVAALLVRIAEIMPLPDLGGSDTPSIRYVLARRSSAGSGSNL